MYLQEFEKKTSGSPYRIVIIVCYFGSRPWYVDLFLHTCAFNPDVDFFLYTDWQQTGPIPQNVVVHPSSLQQIRQLATEQLGFQVALENAYKLCDLRPAYGVIFANHIREYDYWGYCDIDVAFGDIRRFITNELLSNHDVISVRKEYLTGFLPFTGI